MTRRRVLLALTAIGAAVAAGPRPQVAPPDASAIRQRIPASLESLPDYLAREESAIPGVHANTEKRIVWAMSTDSTPRRTSRSVVYLHGFSATRQETAPFSEELARELHANLFETRLTGHGLASDAMGRVTATGTLLDHDLSDCSAVPDGGARCTGARH